MPITKKVRDLMVPLSDYAVTSPESTLRDAIPSLQRLYCQVEAGKCTHAGHRNILVLDEHSHLVGILNFSSILRVLIPEIAGGLSGKIESFGISLAFAQADSQDLDENRASFRARVIRNAETRVKAVMLKVKGTIDADADLLDGLRSIYQNKVTVLPVFEKGKLIGVLRECDLFLCVAEVLAE